MSVHYRLRPHVLEGDEDGAWAGILPDGPILRVSGSGRWILAILADRDLHTDPDTAVAGPAGPAPSSAPSSAPAQAPALSPGGATVAQVTAALRRDLLQAPADLEDAVTLFLTAMVRSGLVEAEEAP